ncbi:MAG: hypothetical protein ABJF05_18855 [Paracoccaceae bacterium]
MSYDEANRRTALTSSAGRSTLAAYADDRLTGLEHFQNSVPVARSGFAYLDDGQISLDEDLTQPAQSRTYTYDDINRLTLVAEGTPATQGGTPVPVEDYAYDEQGNRTFSHISSTYAVDDHNRLLEDDDYTYTYDVKGNRITRKTKADGTLQTYTYDSVNQLIAVLEDGTPIAEYAYDVLGRRIAKPSLVARRPSSTTSVASMTQRPMIACLTSPMVNSPRAGSMALTSTNRSRSKPTAPTQPPAQAPPTSSMPTVRGPSSPPPMSPPAPLLLATAMTRSAPARSCRPASCKIAASPGVNSTTKPASITSAPATMTPHWAGSCNPTLSASRQETSTSMPTPGMTPRTGQIRPA